MDAQRLAHRDDARRRRDCTGCRLSLLAPAPRGGCMKWGMCDTPSAPTDDAEEITE